jgi:hypothetical protein
MKEEGIINLPILKLSTVFGHFGPGNRCNSCLWLFKQPVYAIFLRQTACFQAFQHMFLAAETAGENGQE